jgi:hypothetical protein
MRRIRNAGVLTIALGPRRPAQTVPETFTATASVKKGEAMASAPATVTVTRYASCQRERGEGPAWTGMTGARKCRRDSDAGFIEPVREHAVVRVGVRRIQDVW